MLRSLLVVIALSSAARADDLRVTQLSVGQGHVCGVTKAQAVVCWGDSAAGQLGVGASGKSAGGELAWPHVVGGLPKIVQISAGTMHTCAIDVDGAVWCWGSAGGDVQASDGGATGSVELKGNALGTPVKMPFVDKAHLVHVSGGGNDACAAFVDEVRCWSTFGAIPIDARAIAAVPNARSYELAGATAIAMGHGKLCAINARGLACWSSGGTPAPVAWKKPKAVSIGEMYACVVSASGEARCWWSLIDEFWKRAPDQVVAWKGKRPTRAISVGDSPICAADDRGGVDCFLSDEGGLTDDAAIDASWATTKLEPHAIPGVAGAIDIGIGRGRDAFGYGFGCALRKTGEVVCWGDNEHGQLGRGDKQRSQVVTPVVDAQID